MLIILGGLPGSGKTTLARALALHLNAVHIRVDTIEQALLSCDITDGPIGVAGYVVAAQLAEDNLRLGHTVIADSVNPVAASRMGWRAAAARANARAVEIEVVCSDPWEHRQRVDTRQADIPNHRLPTWQDIVDRQYDAWQPDLVIDTAGRSIDDTLVRAIIGLQAKA